MSLPPNARSVLLEVARRMGDVGRPLTLQVSEAVVTSCSPTWIDMTVPTTSPAGPWPDGPLPLSLSPGVIDEDGEPVAAIHVWLTAGRLSAVEQGWYSDDPPSDWPPVDRLVWG